MIEKYLLIHPSGSLKWVDLERLPRHDSVYVGEAVLDVRDMYPIIGCSCVEQVRTVIPGIVILVDECGKVKNPAQAHNELASRLYAGWHYALDDITGPALCFSLKPTPYGELDLFPLSPSDEAKLSLCLGMKLPDK